jgi:outer membrane protein assembly factor BamB
MPNSTCFFVCFFLFFFFLFLFFFFFCAMFRGVRLFFGLLHVFSAFAGNLDSSPVPSNAEFFYVKWKATPSPWQRQASVTVLSDGTLITRHMSTKFPRVENDVVTARHPSNGTARWSFRSGRDPGGYDISVASSHDAVTVFLAASTALVALRTADGSEQWRLACGRNCEVPPTVSPMGAAACPECVYFVCDNSLQAVQASNGSVVWTYNDLKYSINSGIAAGGGGAIFFSTTMSVRAVSAASGAHLWTFRADTVGTARPALSPNADLVYVSALGGLICVLDAANGTVVSTMHLGGSLADNPAVRPDGRALCARMEDGRVLLVNAADGLVLWTFATSNTVNAAPAFDDEGNLFFSSDKVFFVLSAAGKEQWALQSFDNFDASPALAADGTVYVGAPGDAFYAINTRAAIAFTPVRPLANVPTSVRLIGLPNIVRDVDGDWQCRLGFPMGVAVVQMVPFSLDDMACSPVPPPRDLGSAELRVSLVNTKTGLPAMSAVVSTVSQAIIVAISAEHFGPDGRRIALVVKAEGLSRWPRCIVNGKRCGCAKMTPTTTGPNVVSTLRIDVTVLLQQQQHSLAADLAEPSPTESTPVLIRERDVCVVNGRGAEPVCGTRDAHVPMPTNPSPAAAPTPRQAWPPTDYTRASPWWWPTSIVLDPTQSWARLLGNLYLDSIAVGPRGHLYAVSVFGILALNSADGSVMQEIIATPDSSNGDYTAGLAIDDGGVVYASAARNVTAIKAPRPTRESPQKWTALWTVSFNDSVETAPSLGPGGVIYVGVGRTLHALNALNGLTKWTIFMDEWVVSAPVFHEHDNETIFVSTAAPHGLTKLYALRTSDAGVRWSLPDVGLAVATARDGAVVYSWRSDKYSAIRADTATLQWTSPISVTVQARIPAIGNDGGTLFLVTDDGKLVAINADDGKTRWTINIAASGTVPPAIGRDGTVYIGASERMMAVCAASGQVFWSFPAGSDILAGPVLGPDGTLFFFTVGGEMHALRSGAAFAVRLDTPLPAVVSEARATFVRQPAALLLRDSSFAPSPVEAASGFAIETSVVGCDGDACSVQPGSISGGSLVSLTSNVIPFSSLALAGGYGAVYTIEFRSKTVLSQPYRQVVQIAACPQVKAQSVPSSDYLSCVCPAGMIDMSLLQSNAGCIAGPAALALDVLPSPRHDVSRDRVFAVQPRVSLRTASGDLFDASRLISSTASSSLKTTTSLSLGEKAPASRSHRPLSATGGVPIVAARVVSSGPFGGASLSGGALGISMSGDSTSFSELALDAARGDTVAITFTAAVILPDGSTTKLFANASVNVTTCDVSFPGAVLDPKNPRTGCLCGVDHSERGGGPSLRCTPCKHGSGTLGAIGAPECTCLDGYVDSEGTCRACAPNAVRLGNTNTCACLPRYEGNGFTCAACPDGTNKTTTGDTRCRCVPGWFREPTSDRCARCPADSFSDTDEATLCTRCPTGSGTSGILGAAFARMCECRSGHFLHAAVGPGGIGGGSKRGGGPGGKGSSSSSSEILPRATLSPKEVDAMVGLEARKVGLEARNTSSLVCAACPTGANCAGGLAGPVAKAGWWTADAENLIFVECDPLVGSCQADGKCSEGYGGVLCEACQPGLGRFGHACLKCSRGRDALALASAVVAIVVVLAFLARTALAARATLPVVVLRAVLDYAQVTFFIGSFGFPFPAVLRRGLLLPSTGSTGGARFLPLDCLFGWDAADTSVVYSAAGIALSLALWLALVSHGLPAVRNARALRLVCVAIVVTVVTLHPTIAVEALGAFRCRDVGGVLDVLAADVRVPCGSRRVSHARAIAAAALAMMSTGSIAVLYAALIVARRKVVAMTPDHFLPDREMRRLETDDDDDGSEAAVAAGPWPALARALAFLSAPYRPERFWWSVVPLARKTAIMAIATRAQGWPAAAVFAAHVVLVLSLAAELALRPYALRWVAPEGSGPMYRRLHRMLLRFGGPAGADAMGLVANFVTLSIGPAFSEAEDGGPGPRTALAVVVALANAPMAIFFVTAVAAYAARAFDRGGAFLAARRKLRTKMAMGERDTPLLAYSG